jgi:hypothetical protein
MLSFMLPYTHPKLPVKQKQKYVPPDFLLRSLHDGGELKKKILKEIVLTVSDIQWLHPDFSQLRM